MEMGQQNYRGTHLHFEVKREYKHTSREQTERKDIGKGTGAEVTVLAVVAVVVKLN
jgi:hypothetical protein